MSPSREIAMTKTCSASAQEPAAYWDNHKWKINEWKLNEVDFLYVIYYLTDDGRYDFYAELTDEASINEIMSEEDEEE